MNIIIVAVVPDPNFLKIGIKPGYWPKPRYSNRFWNC